MAQKNDETSSLCSSLTSENVPIVLPNNVTELVRLLQLKSVKENVQELKRVVWALWNIALSDTGRQSCIDAGVPLALVTLSGEKAVKEDGDAAGYVASALGHIAESESGRQSCIDAGVPLALVTLSGEKSVKENGDAAQWVARALGKIAE